MVKVIDLSSTKRQQNLSSVRPRSNSMTEGSIAERASRLRRHSLTHVAAPAPTPLSKKEVFETPTMPPLRSSQFAPYTNSAPCQQHTTNKGKQEAVEQPKKKKPQPRTITMTQLHRAKKTKASFPLMQQLNKQILRTGRAQITPAQARQLGI